MQSPGAIPSAPAAGTGGFPARLRRALVSKLWLPRPVYELLPYAYIFAGAGALTAALYLPGWTWILPYLLLIGLAGIHAGLALVALRYRCRRRARADSADDD